MCLPWILHHHCDYYIRFVGGGDGTLVQMRGSGPQFEPVQQTRLYGSVASITVNSSNASRGLELLVGTSAGMIYLMQVCVNARTLRCVLHCPLPVARCPRLLPTPPTG